MKPRYCKVRSNRSLAELVAHGAKSCCDALESAYTGRDGTPQRGAEKVFRE